MFKEILKRLRKRVNDGGVGALLQDVSKELRSDSVPPALRQAAEAVAALLAGQVEASGVAREGTVVINISVAVAVGAPGKPDDKSAGDGATPNEAVVVATAVASTPAPSLSATATAGQDTPQAGLDSKAASLPAAAPVRRSKS